MKQILIGSVFFVVAGVVCFFSSFGMAPAVEMTLVGEDKLKMHVTNNNKFAFDFYRKIVASEKGNVFFSPYGIRTAFSMLHIGANGNTKIEIAEALGFVGYDKVKTDPHTLNAALASKLRFDPKHNSYKLNLANAIFIRNGFQLQKGYVQSVRSRYRALVEGLDFANVDASCKRIDKWCSENTGGRIRNIATPEMLKDHFSRLVILNAMYFKSAWMKGFDKTATHTADFICPGGKKIKCKMMHDTSEEGFLRLPGLTVLRKRYSMGDTSLIVVLPDKDRALNFVENQISVGHLESWMKKIRDVEVEVYLPKLRIEASFDVIPVMKALGINDVFDRAKSNLEEITDSGERLYVSSAFHKTFIEVDEGGTEAAAVTEEVCTAAECEEFGTEPEPELFRADRPFMFMVRHELTGAVLFVGRVNEVETIKGDSERD